MDEFKKYSETNRAYKRKISNRSSEGVEEKREDFDRRFVRPAREARRREEAERAGKHPKLTLKTDYSDSEEEHPASYQTGGKRLPKYLEESSSSDIESPSKQEINEVRASESIDQPSAQIEDAERIFGERYTCDPTHITDWSDIVKFYDELQYHKGFEQLIKTLPGKTGDYILVKVKVKISEGNALSDINPAYIIIFNLDKGIALPVNLQKKVFDEIYTVPGTRPLPASEMIFRTHEWIAQQEGFPLKLKELIFPFISNRATESLLNSFTDESSENPLTLKKGNEKYDECFKSPLGKVLDYLLNQHKDDYENEELPCIEVFDSNEPEYRYSLRFFTESADPGRTL